MDATDFVAVTSTSQRRIREHKENKNLITLHINDKILYP